MKELNAMCLIKGLERPITVVSSTHLIKVFKPCTGLGHAVMSEEGLEERTQPWHTLAYYGLGVSAVHSHMLGSVCQRIQL